jgi:cyanophycin synthetase
MKIINIKVLRGPNFWSSTKKELIVLTIDTQETETLNTKVLKDFAAKLQAIMPSCLKRKDDFLFQVKRGISLIEVIGPVAVELQVLSGMKCDFVLTCGVSPGIYNVVYPFIIEKAGIYAGETAVKIVATLAQNNDYTNVQNDIDTLTAYKLKSPIGPTTSYILNEVKKRQIPFREFNEGSLIILGYGNKQHKIRTAIADTTSGLGIELAGDKNETKKMLSEAHIPVPNGILISSEDELRSRIREVKFPLVIKPLNGNEGRGVTTNINSVAEAEAGFRYAQQVSPIVIAEEFIQGNDYRFLVIDYKLEAVAQRIPASIQGDGNSTVRQLIKKENKNPDRGTGPEHILDPIEVDQVTLKLLADKQLTLDSVIKEGEIVQLKGTANISSGGTATDVTDAIHPENVFLSERIACLFNLDICGIDIVANSIEEPITHTTGAIIEVNAGPGLRMHSNPQMGVARDVASPIIDMLYPDVKDSRVPVIAVEDFNEGAILTKLLAHIAQTAGYKPGCNTSDGIYVHGHLTCKGNCTTFKDVQEVLFERYINFAIVQCAAESIADSGLGFNMCDISIVAGTPAAGSEKSSFLFGSKDLVIEHTDPNGYVILNADNDEAYKKMQYVKSNVALFSNDKHNERIEQHLERNGWVAVFEVDSICIYKGYESRLSFNKSDIPLYDQNLPGSIPEVVLPAILTAVIEGFSFSSIRKGLSTFSLLKKSKELV